MYGNIRNNIQKPNFNNYVQKTINNPRINENISQNNEIIKNLQNKLNEKESALKIVQDEKEKILKERDDYYTTNKNQKKENKENIKKLNDLNNKYIKIKNECSFYSEAKLNLEKKNKELIEQNKIIQNDLNVITNKMNDISLQNEKNSNLIKNLNKEKEEMIIKIKQYEEYCKSLKEQNDNLQGNINQCNNNIIELKNKLKQNDKNLNELKSKHNELNNLYSNNKKGLEELTIKYNEKENSYSQLLKQYESTLKILKEKDSKLSDALDKLNLLNEEKMTLENENKKIIQEQKNKIIYLESDLNKLKKEKESLTTELKNTHSKYEGIIYTYEKMNNQLEEKEKILGELSIIKEENKDLKEKCENFKTVIENEETKEEYLVEPAEKYYDVVIDINSINSLKNEGWSIKYNKERKEIYDKIISERTMKIGVLGLNNVGKSFLLSKLIETKDIPTGHSIETKGISIKYSDENLIENNTRGVKGICILDSAGFETPLLKDEKQNNENDKINKDNESSLKNGQNELESAIKYDEIEDDLSRDKAQTERFIEQLIISLSDMLILVIGKLTRTEQRLITRIKNMAKKNEKNKIKSIIIVHNLERYHKIKEVEKHISQYLTKSATFEISERDYIGTNNTYKGRKYFVEVSDEPEEIQVFHYIMAKEKTQAGDYYNGLTLELIKQQYNNFNNRKPINIPDEIINLFSELSTDIMGEKMECEKTGTEEIVIKLKENEIKDKKKKTICVQNAYIDQDGNYLKNKGKFEPKYSLYYYKEKKKKSKEDEEYDDEEEIEYEKFLLLRLEIPGNIIRLTARSTDPKKEKFNGIVIKGLKKIDTFKEQSSEDFSVISDNRSYDEFTYFIELKRNLELSKSSANGFTDIYEIHFDKRNKEKIFQKETTQTNTSLNKEINQDNKIPSEANEKYKVNISSGVYVMKFQLTERSYIPNK